MILWWVVVDPGRWRGDRCDMGGTVVGWQLFDGKKLETRGSGRVDIVG